MANELKAAKVFSIQALHAQGWSHRRIAHELGIHRETVARHLNAASGEAQEPAGPTDPKPAKAPPGSRSRCEPLRSVIEGKLRQGLSAQRIFQDLVDEHGFEGRYPSVRRLVATLRESTPVTETSRTVKTRAYGDVALCSPRARKQRNRSRPSLQ